MEKTFKLLIRELIGEPVTFNFGIDFAGSGTLAAVHDDCVEIHHKKFNHPQDRTPSGVTRQFVQLAHLRSIGEKA